ncbi:aminotransferase class V-fold PLP-dependent enzyme [Desulfosporosinus shakirovi]|uniref:aminotransferase class V-fold PLP-dependent enzyme n=1 Tax=Desulfosporosinus shakirovi TaxID=2885154 RepID=UPI001E4B3305|nr:aminotransferase class V-fold PLP-dependent enzyme [Desulfosporosinus sp. SRJS8]MCB8814722.1 aminotransferase class V-fold PLP-dependent enzyme [Desulfosporosinus sp. SRJS8]
MPIYLDYCASAPIDPRVLEEVTRIFKDVYGNADSRTHLYGTRAKEVVEKSRKTLADLLAVDKSEVIFTSGATESDNMAILGLMDYGIETGKKHLITTAIEHKAVLESMHHLANKGFVLDIVYPDASGRIKAFDILTKVRPDTLLVSVMHVNNETGIIQPIVEIGSELAKKEVLFHIDAAQSFGKLNDELRATKYDMLSLSSHKIQGPQGVGAIILKRKKYKRPPIKPLFYGGKQEYGFRPGTTPVPLVSGFALAAELCEKEHFSWIEGCQLVKEQFLDAIHNLNYVINGDQDYCLPNVINISFLGVDSESVFATLKDHYAFSNGSACNSGNYSSSHVLTAMGLNENQISCALRISWNREGFSFINLIEFVKNQIS